MSIFNFGLECQTTEGGNIGIGNCNQGLKNVKGLIFLPKGTTFKSTDIPNIVATLKTMSEANAWGNRLQIVTDIKGAENTNTEATTGSYGYGLEVVSQEAKVSRTYTLVGTCLYNAMKGIKNRHSSYDVVLVHDDNVLLFTSGTENGEAIIKGFTLDAIEVGLYNETIQENLENFTLRIALANSSEWENLTPVKPVDGMVLTELSSLKNVVLNYIKATPVVPGTYRIALSDCSASSFTEIYDTEIVTLTNFIAEDAANGNVIPIDGITISNNQLVFTLDDTDPNFTAATTIRIKGALYSVLKANGIEGFSIGSIQFPKA